MIEKLTLNELRNELTFLQSRARTVGYKNALPKMPSGKRISGEPPVHLMTGFYMRLGNWINGLVQLENNIIPSSSRRNVNDTQGVNDNLTISN